MSDVAESSSAASRRANPQNSTLSAWGIDRLSLCTLPYIYWGKVDTSSQQLEETELDMEPTQEEDVVAHRLPQWDISCMSAGGPDAHLLSFITGLYLYDVLKALCPIFFEISNFEAGLQDFGGNYHCAVSHGLRLDSTGNKLLQSEQGAIGSTEDPRSVPELIRQGEAIVAAQPDINSVFRVLHVRIRRAGAPSVVIKQFPDTTSPWWQDWRREQFFRSSYTTILVSKGHNGTDLHSNNEITALAESIHCKARKVLYLVENVKKKNRLHHLTFDDTHISLSNRTESQFRKEIKDRSEQSNHSTPLQKEILEHYASQLNMLGGSFPNQLVEAGNTMIQQKTTDILNIARERLKCTCILLSPRGLPAPSRLDGMQLTRLKNRVQSFISAFDSAEKLRDTPRLIRSQVLRLLPFTKSVYDYLLNTLPPDHPILEGITNREDPRLIMASNEWGDVLINEGPVRAGCQFRDGTLKRIIRQLELVLDGLADTLRAEFLAAFTDMFGSSTVQVLKSTVLDVEIKHRMSNVKARLNTEISMACNRWMDPGNDHIRQAYNSFHQWYSLIRRMIKADAEQAVTRSVPSLATELWDTVSSPDPTNELAVCAELRVRSEVMVEPIAANVTEILFAYFVNPIKEAITGRLSQDLSRWVTHAQLSKEDKTRAFDGIQRLLNVTSKNMPSIP
ncbi:hypothetical protein SISSUDRAFT_1054762 [Sistotremastrum suecicum HHB10207 ss-3]|uniref:Uncharacterized protein n=1 Tax=Sistotremastrum suecicum HHB10207 ss-3 TaxID=1314776 RepID=A0A165Y918_9AGAM|nr:hypothetical protein SISSUDRAFT_1056353 [Sistotremastrum suecicum HHB10207 ss-3]KZT32994.1 hypothetical protein SISSUDRAFT_1054737 [Sistotremastrum suecicum HHB10207 ss-3]KZT33005.1 hypothetical protein SISSUDRAFT_1054762 [Sistotremastrum suecicum HHB10207 ss-3]